MPEMMKALVKRNAEKGIWMEQVPIPEIGPNDVLVKLEKTAICGTDLHILKGDVPEVEPGRVLGHEAVGTVTEVGPAVQTSRDGARRWCRRPGQRVALRPLPAVMPASRLQA